MIFNHKIPPLILYVGVNRGNTWNGWVLSVIWKRPVPFPVGINIPSGSISKRNCVVFLLILPNCKHTFACSRTAMEIASLLKRWLIKSKCTFVALPRRDICESNEKKVSFIFLAIHQLKPALHQYKLLNAWSDDVDRCKGFFDAHISL